MMVDFCYFQLQMKSKSLPIPKYSWIYYEYIINSGKQTPVPYAVSSVHYLWSKALFIGMNKGSDTLAFCFPLLSSWSF